MQTWLGTAVVADLPNRWEASLEYRLRLVDNASTYRGSYATAEVQRGITDFLDLLGSYRLAVVDDGKYHRFALGAQAAADVGSLRLSFRPMLQYQRQNFADNDEQSSDEKTLLRTRFRARYPLSDVVDIYASVEPYFTFSGDYPIDNLRNTAGLQYEFRAGRTLEVFYIYRPDYAKSYNRTFHIVGLELSFDIDIG